MLNEQTMMKMENLRLFGMAKAFKELGDSRRGSEVSGEEFIGLLIDAETTARENIKLKRLLENARLKQQASLEDIDYHSARSIHKKIIYELSDCRWIENHQNVLISGPTGIGKSFLTCALGNCACRHGYSVFYSRAPRLFTNLFQARGDGSYLKYLAKLAHYDVLIIDDIGVSPMNETEKRDLLEIVEDRNLTSSMIVASQIPIKDWYQIIGDPTLADAICDRLLQNAYKLELKGESMRKNARKDKIVEN